LFFGSQKAANIDVLLKTYTSPNTPNPISIPISIQMSAKPTQKSAAVAAAPKQAPKPAAAKPAEKPAAEKPAAEKQAAEKPVKPAAEKVVKPAAEVKPAVVKAPVVKAPVQETGDNVESHGRIQLANVLHINISQARCATHLKQHLGDDAIETQVKALRAELKTAQDKGDAAAVTTLREKIAAAGKSLVRISSETPIAVAVVWDCVVKELLRRGMDRAIAADRKIVDVTHLHEGDAAAALTLSPLYSKCQLWSSFNVEQENALKKERAAAPKVEEAPVEGAEDDEQSKNSFYTYVENALKTVKRDEQYKTMRVSNRVREYVAELVTQGIGRNTALSRIIVQRIVGVRTMNADHIKVVVNMLMADSGRSETEINTITKLIDEKLALYHNHLQSERAKKVRTLDADQQAALAQKNKDITLARKKKQAELLRKRAVDNANAAKALIAEVSTLEAAAKITA